jgi:asparagine synthase (glutamine-hydrolysing)
MNALLRHRGPDDDGVYLDGQAGVGIAARRLSVIDVEGGHQPIANEDGTVWAALNGEIYNHPALRERLRADGHNFATGTDTEILVHAYEQYGEDLVHHLEGMFAFAVWDAPRRRLMVARDRFGEKPLYYTDRGGALTFASELTALRSGVPGRWDLDPAAIDAFFVLGYIPGPRTVFSNASQLPPGHLLFWDVDHPGVRLRRYWTPPVTHAKGGVPAAELVSETRRLLERSVAARMIADVPLGVLLSGGVDSTLVAAIAAAASSSRLKTFTVGYDTGAVNELEPARRAATALGSDHHQVVLRSSDVAARVGRVITALDQPLADEALVAMHALAEFARQEVTVVIGGEGADELFCGYPRYTWLFRAERLHRVAPRRALVAASRGASALGDSRRARRLRDLLTPQSTAVRSASWVTAGRPEARDHVYGPRLHALMATMEGIVGPARENGACGCPVAAAMRRDQEVWLPDDVLMKADRASMQVSLELRTPYLERDLAEFAYSVPIDVHRRGGGKYLLRETLAQLMPGAVSHRKKVAFRTPTADWLRGPLTPLVEEHVLHGALTGEGWFDAAALTRLARQHSEGQEDHTGVLWPALTLGLWLDSLRSAALA